MGESELAVRIMRRQQATVRFDDLCRTRATVIVFNVPLRWSAAIAIDMLSSPRRSVR